MDALGQDASFWAGRRVALTGATGFLGHHLTFLLHRLGARLQVLARDPLKAARLDSLGVTCVYGDLAETSALARLTDGAEFLFHLAGAVAFHGPKEYFERVNVEGTRRALDAARAAGVARFIHTSSVAAVGATASPQLLDETFTWNLGPLRIPYLASKHAAEEMVLAAGEDVVVVNPTCIVGPDDEYRSEFGTLCRRFWRGRTFVYFGGGMNFVDVRDAAQGMLLAARRGLSGERYLLGGVNRSWTNFFRDLAQAAGRAIPRVRLPGSVADVIGWLQERFPRQKKGRPWLTRSQAQMSRLFMYCTSAKARTQLGYEPRPWSLSLRDTYAYWHDVDRDRRQAA
jgi:dihydroflavonol-4-reductase